MVKNSAHECQMGYNINGSIHSQTSSAAQRRVWIRRWGGNPTSIMMSKHDIIDDLKTAALKKFPNTLAKNYESSDLRIFLVLQKRDQMQQTKILKIKAPVNRLKNEPNEDSTHRSSVLKDNNIELPSLLLESDKNVWEALDEYFDSEMKMTDALLILEAKEQFHLLPNKHTLSSEFHDNARVKNFEHTLSPSPSQSSLKQQSSAESSLQTPKPQKSQKVFKVLEKHSPDALRNPGEAASYGNSLRRSESSPSQSPISFTTQSKTNSQAVLLLPKNFSLGEQNPLKRLSLDENSTNKSGYKPEGNLTNLQVSAQNKPPASKSEELSHQSKPQDCDTGGETSEKSAQKKTVLTRGNRDDLIDKMNSKNELKKHEARRTQIDKTFTSTFEQVLPSISVLVVEDNSINQAILGAFLRKHKIHYQIAKNGQEAVDKWRKGGFHLVLMDIQLPVKSGIEATKEIRLLERINRIGVFAQHELGNGQSAGNFEIRQDQQLDLGTFRSPVIIVALTASSNSSIDRKNALTAGCNDYLTKPVNLVWLQNKITEWGCMQALIDFDGWRSKGTSGISSSHKNVSAS